MQRLGVGHHQAVLLLGSFRSTDGTNNPIYRNEREPSPPSTHDDAMRRRYDASIQTRNLPPHSDRECHLRFLEGVTVHRRPSVLLANPYVTEKQQRKENVDFPKPALINPERRRLRTPKLAQERKWVTPTVLRPGQERHDDRQEASRKTDSTTNIEVSPDDEREKNPQTLPSTFWPFRSATTAFVNIHVQQDSDASGSYRTRRRKMQPRTCGQHGSTRAFQLSCSPRPSLSVHPKQRPTCSICEFNPPNEPAGLLV